MRARFINEINFERGLEPLRSMGIGYPMAIKKKVEDSIGTVDEQEVEIFIEEFGEEVGGIFEVYLPYEEKEKLYWLCKFIGKKNIAIRDVYDDDDRVPEKFSDSYVNIRKWLYKKFVQPLLDKGWEIFWEENNFDITQYILINLNPPKKI